MTEGDHNLREHFKQVWGELRESRLFHPLIQSSKCKVGQRVRWREGQYSGSGHIQAIRHVRCVKQTGNEIIEDREYLEYQIGNPAFWVERVEEI